MQGTCSGKKFSPCSMGILTVPKTFYFPFLSAPTVRSECVQPEFTALCSVPRIRQWLRLIPKNLKGHGSKSEIRQPNANGSLCSDARCLMCKHSTNTDSFKSPIMARTFKIFGNTSCRTDYCTYLISCKVCSKQYVSETGDLRRKINNHHSTVKNKK